MKCTIPAENLLDVEKRLARLAAKAAKYGKTLSYTMGDERPYNVRVLAPLPPYGELGEVDRYTVAAVDIDINADIIQCDGWTVCAHIEHTDAGNIVTAIDGDTRPEWRTIPAYCDHCATNRPRAYTYIIRDEDGNHKQVGTACLHDYTGINADIAAAFVALTEDVIVDDIAPEGYAPGEYRPRYAHVYTAREVLATAVACIARRGYIRANEPDSTRDQIIRALDGRGDNAYTADDMSKAAAIADYLRAYAGNDDILCNARVMVASDICKPSQVGRLAYVPVAVAREQERALKILERANVEAVSSHVGNVGERLTINVTDCTLLTSWATDYGTTYLYKMHDAAGNVFVWFTSKVFGVESLITRPGCDWQDYIFTPFERGTIKATIKSHDERDGVKQTILTRCKIV